MSSPIPQPPAKKQVPTGRIVALAVLAVVVFCVGGLAVIGAVLGPSDDTKKPAADSQAQPVLEAPATSSPAAAEPTAEATTAPTTAPTSTAIPTATATARPAVAPTTTKPQPRRTTVKPTTKAPKPKPKPTTKKPTPKPTTKAPGKTVTPGAFCAPEGATGVSKKGKLYRCTRKAGEDRARWRAA